MHNIEMHEVSAEFERCWRAAGRHIQTRTQGPLHSRLKVNLNPPFLEHLSFRLGNQLFFIRIEDVDGKLTVPGTREGLLAVAKGCNGHACIMPMQQRGVGWEPQSQDWRLVDLQTGASIEPMAFITDEQIEMTDWELQDFAVQIVRDQLENKRNLCRGKVTPASTLRFGSSEKTVPNGLSFDLCDTQP